MNLKDHWEGVYTTKAAHAVSWYQPRAVRSLSLIEQTGLPLSAAIIDIGGGASTLVDDLLAAGHTDLTVLDLSAAALRAAQARVGEPGAALTWLEADITQAELPSQAFDLWHDRAVFHFLTAAGDRLAYLQAVQRALRPGGHMIIATFAEDGPDKCSGLAVQRYSAESLHTEVGEAFTLLRHEQEAHATPFGTVQSFIYCLFRLNPGSFPARAVQAE